MKLGVNDAGRIPCARSKHHPAHPHNEPCGYCESWWMAPEHAARRAEIERRNAAGELEPVDLGDEPYDPFGAWNYLWP